MTNSYYLRNIKTLLNDGFTEEELRDFCFFEPAFRPVYEQLPPRSGHKRQIIRLLIDYAARKGLLDTLLRWAEKVNPTLYHKNQPYIEEETTSELEQDDRLTLQFVTAAMTYSEAEALTSGKIFDDPGVAADEKEQFQRLQETLLEQKINDLLSHYADGRDDWRPPFHEGYSIRQTIVEMVERVNATYSNTPGAVQIYPHFISENFFSYDQQTRLNSWQSTESGCIIVADSVSLFHPGLRKMLVESEMSSREEVALLILSPVNFRQIPVNLLIEEKIMERALNRLNGELKWLSEFGAGDLRILRRWLFATLPEIVSQRRQANPENRNALRERLGKQPRGLAPLNW